MERLTVATVTTVVTVVTVATVTTDTTFMQHFTNIHIGDDGDRGHSMRDVTTFCVTFYQHTHR